MKKYIKIFLISIFIFLINILNVSAEENIELISVELKEKSPYVEINEEVSLDGNKIISNVNFFDEGDYVIYKFRIKNNDNKDYKIDEIFDNNDSDYLSFEYTYDDTIGAKEEKEVLLKITYKSLLPYDTTLTPEHEFNAVNEISVSIKLSEEVINPNTFDKAHIYLIIEVMCVLVLLTIFIKLKKKNGVLILILAILLIPKNINAKVEFNINFTFKNTMNLKVNYLDQGWKTKITDSYNKLEFIKTLEYPEGAIDVSQEQDESIKAWIEEGTLYIGSKYKIFFPEDSSFLFRNLNLININFNERVDTTFVSKYYYMFAGNNYDYLDLSSFRTGNAKTFESMFYNNTNLKELDLSNFDTSKLQYVSSMFAGCTMNNLIIDNWDFSKVDYICGFIASAPEIKNISAKNIVFPENAYGFFEAYDSSFLKSIDLTGADTSNTTSFNSLFYQQKMLSEIKGLEDFDTSKVTDIGYVLKNVGANISDDAIISFDLSKWDVSNVTNFVGAFEGLGKAAKEVYLTIDGWENNLATSFNEAFRDIGINSKKVIINLSNFNFSEITEAERGFCFSGKNSDEITININNWNMPKLENAYSMFISLGENAKTVNLDLENISVPILSYVGNMFEYVGDDALYVNATFKNWDMSLSPNASCMFYYFAANTVEEVNLTIENFDLSSATNLSQMFYTAARDTKKLNFKFTNFNMSNASNVRYMFNYVGVNSDEWSFEGLGSLDLRNATNLSSFIGGIAGTNKPLRVLETIDVYNDFSSIFYGNYNIKATINIHENPSNYNDIFNYIATSDDSEIILNYTEKVTDIDNIIQSSNNPHIKKGVLIED